MGPANHEDGAVDNGLLGATPRRRVPESALDRGSAVDVAPRTLIEIDRSSSAPLYRQVRRAIEHAIATGIFPVDRRLPSSRELSEELGISRNVVNLAYQELIAEGFVVSHERRGLFVNNVISTQRGEDAPPEPRVDPPDDRINWRARVRSFGDVDLPHVIKRPNWWEYPYPFVTGQVDLQAFPARAWTRVLRESLYRPHLTHSLQDAGARDDPMLVDMIRLHLLPARGIQADRDEILVTVGSQQGLDLVSRVLIGAGHQVMMENPGYLDAQHIFARAGAEIVGVSVDRHGLSPPTTLRGISLLYLTPSHHHPTNVTMSLERRQELLALAARSGTVILEDDYDSEFRYSGQPTPALKAIDASGDVVYVGTVSKFLAPGLRLGYLVGPRELVSALREARRYSTRHAPGQLQRAMALLIESGDYQRTIRRRRSELKNRWEVIVDAVNSHLTWKTHAPPGGVSLWIPGPPELDCGVLERAAARRGVLIERGDIFFLPDPSAANERDSRPHNHFRLGFSAIPVAQIEPGIARLAQVIDEQLG